MNNQMHLTKVIQYNQNMIGSIWIYTQKGGKIEVVSIRKDHSKYNKFACRDSNVVRDIIP